jgi:hypothetical protein
MNVIIRNTELGAIYKSLNTLNINELEAVMQQIIGIRKQKMPNVLSEVESELLKKINTTISPTIQKRYDKLLRLKVKENLLETDYQELIELSTFVELHNNQRLEYIIELSQYRNQSFDDTLEALGLKSQINVL